MRMRSAVNIYSKFGFDFPAWRNPSQFVDHLSKDRSSGAPRPTDRARSRGRCRSSRPCTLPCNAHSDDANYARGSRSVNVVPVASLEVTEMSPPWASTISLAM